MSTDFMFSTSRKKGYQEGGLQTDDVEIEPNTGNEVPPGSLPEEVRDDIDAKLSDGEYVLPADVVRFIGLAQIESLVQQAKAGLQQMEASGRIGGEPVDDDGVPLEDDEEDEVELTPEEEQMLMEVMNQKQAAQGMAYGGAVSRMMEANEEDDGTPGPKPKKKKDKDDDKSVTEKKPYNPVEFMQKEPRVSEGLGPDDTTAPKGKNVKDMSYDDQMAVAKNMEMVGRVTGALFGVPIGAMFKGLSLVAKNMAKKNAPQTTTATTSTTAATTATAPEVTDALSNPAEPAVDVAAEMDQATKGESETEGSENDSGSDAGQADGGNDSGSEADQGGDPDGEGSGESGMSRGGLASKPKRPQNKRKKPYRNKRRGLASK